ncbi:OST-HTH/LOTUS domain-containing protein [Paraglaciecola sp. MB-3u-78]|uniref:OST-HTH/LOTUS domain-containing protein n=1 Tax=Paraglaciecola sp. MB-3u-78 TaxID=2058332 RepID=UPI000C33CE1A|nr:OST-HTH/LOTUS domain-containing protein [Paraglaciecola sp. MB-3u-78]PKG93145.1 hypothetical protein CXF95_26520 [Paraglaciecola sp. MB-3u-78]
MKNEEFVDEVLRKVGRNVVLFQQLEQLFKFIVANGNLAGFTSEIKTLKQQQENKVNKQTMGTLVGEYVESSNPMLEAGSHEPEQLDEAYLSFSFRIKFDEDYYQSQKATLAQLVSDRNDLIHHLLPRFNINSAKSCEALGQELDEQAEKIRLEIKNVQSVAKALHKGREELGDYLQSEKGRKELELSFLRQSHLVLMLGDIATQISREDGWALISSAGHLIKEHAPEELEKMKEKHGYSSLKKLIQASKIFDIHEEATPKGGARILYRLKAEWVT